MIITEQQAISALAKLVGQVELCEELLKEIAVFSTDKEYAKRAEEVVRIIRKVDMEIL
ncbi:hypothetical protein vBPpSSYP_121 [Pseudomonas phage vB_PpS_SYP]|nr:hypothetical protein vBPpSSYP_121 [Pseudomonas phage vB_PpS_SYP]